jgi:hypothetical protein
MRLTHLSLQRAPRIGRLMPRPPSAQERVIAFRVAKAELVPVEFANARFLSPAQAYAAGESAPDPDDLQAAFEFKYDTRSIA